MYICVVNDIHILSNYFNYSSTRSKIKITFKKSKDTIRTPHLTSSRRIGKRLFIRSKKVTKIPKYRILAVDASKVSITRSLRGKYPLTKSKNYKKGLITAVYDVEHNVPYYHQRPQVCRRHMGLQKGL